VKSKIEIAWASGVIEGEGSIIANLNGRSKFNGEPYLRCQLRVCMTDKDIIQKLQAVFGVGIVAEYNNLSRLGKKPIWRWDVRRALEAKVVCELIYPYMGQRRKKQIEHLFEQIVLHPPISNHERNIRMWITRKKNK